MSDKYEGYNEVSSYEASDNLGFKLLLRIEGGMTEKVRDVIRSVTYDLDRRLRMAIAQDSQKVQAKREETIKELLACFPGYKSYEPIDNQYCGLSCCLGRPWLKVKVGIWGPVITIGWRKRVIEIRWEGGPSPDELFEAEDVTKGVDRHKGEESYRYIHAWGPEKAKEYLKKLLGD